MWKRSNAWASVGLAFLGTLLGCSEARSSTKPANAPTPAPAASLSASLPEAPPKPAPIAASAPGAARAVHELQERLNARFPDRQGLNLALETGMHQTDVVDADVDAAETFAVTVSEDKTARVWSLADGKQTAVMRLPGPGQTGELFAVAVSPDGKRVAIGGFDGGIYLFDAASWRLTRVISPNRGTIHALRYSHDGKRLAVGFHGKHGLSVYETAHYVPIFDDQDFAGDIYGVAFSASGHLVVTSWDRKVRLYSAKHQLLATTAEFPTRPYRVAFDPSGKRVAVGFIDAALIRVLSVPKLTTERELGPAIPESSSLATVAFAKEGSQILASGRYKINGHNPILRWKADFSPLDSWLVHENTPECLHPLKGGKVLLATQDPLIALLRPDGSVGWSHSNSAPDFWPHPTEHFLASKDASSVGFIWGRGDATNLRFDVRQPGWIDDEAPRALGRAVTQSPRIEVQSWLNSRDPFVGDQRLDVEPFEICRALSIAATTGFLLGCEWNVYRYDDSGRRIWKHGTPGSTRAAYLSEDAQVAVVAFDDGTIHWLNASDGSELVTVAFTGPDRDWVAWTPAGFYVGTKAGEHALGLNVLHKNGSAEFVPLEEYADLMRRPDVIRQAIDTAYVLTGNTASL